MAISRAALRTIDILELIASKAKGITLSEIADALRMPVTSVNDIVKALLERDMIEIIDERSKLYGVGAKSYFIGNAFISNTSLVDKAKTIVEELALKVNKTVFIGKEVKERITYIYKYEPKDTLIATCSIGSRTYLHTTSLGKCILANDADLFDRISKQELIKKTPRSITDPAELRLELEKVRLKGYAVDNREQDDHLLCIGAPIFDHNGKVTAAISISGLYSDHADIECEAGLIKEKALILSQKMGYKG